jgi:hypothetical protein
MVAVDAVIIEVLSCNNASMRYIFKGEKPANLPAQAPTKYRLGRAGDGHQPLVIAPLGDELQATRSRPTGRVTAHKPK